jgi:hypothetical protein
MTRGERGGANNPEGVNQHTPKEVNRDIITVDHAETQPERQRDHSREAPTGDSVSYAVRRLARGRPDLLARVEAGPSARVPWRAAADRGRVRATTMSTRDELRRRHASAVRALREAYRLLRDGAAAEAEEVIADWLAGHGELPDGDPNLQVPLAQAFEGASFRARMALCYVGACSYLAPHMRRRWTSGRYVDVPCPSIGALLRDLVAKSDEDLLGAPECGPVTLREIQDRLARYGLRLRKRRPMDEL